MRQRRMGIISRRLLGCMRCTGSVCFAASSGSGGGGILFSAVEGCDCSAGGDSADSAVPGAGGGSDCAEDYASGDAAAVSDVAVSAAGVAGYRWISFHLVQSGELAEGDAICGGDSTDGSCHLYGAGLEGFGVALWGNRESKILTAEDTGDTDTTGLARIVARIVPSLAWPYAVR